MDNFIKNDDSFDLFLGDRQSASTIGICEAEVDVLDKQRKLMYYINNGVYGVFLHWKFADITLPVHSLKVPCLVILKYILFFIIPNL